MAARRPSRPGSATSRPAARAGRASPRRSARRPRRCPPPPPRRSCPRTRPGGGRARCSASLRRSWLQTRVARSVCCRVSPARLPPRSSASASPRRSQICSGDRAAARAAASSIASGMPSSRLADLRHGAGVVGVQGEARGGVVRALAEEADRLRALELREIGMLAGLGQRQRRHPPGHLAVDAQALAARGHDVQVRAGAQQPVDQRARRPRSGARSCRARSAGADRRSSPPARHSARSRSAAAAPSAGDRLVGHQGGIRDRGELDHAHAVLEVGLPSRGQLERESRLAAAAGSGQRQQARAVERLVQLGQLALTADEAGELVREHWGPGRGLGVAFVLGVGLAGAREESRGRARASRGPARPRARAAACRAAAGTARAPAAGARSRRTGASGSGARPRASGPRPQPAGASRWPPWCRRPPPGSPTAPRAARDASRAATRDGRPSSPRSGPRAAARPCRARAPPRGRPGSARRARPPPRARTPPRPPTDRRPRA